VVAGTVIEEPIVRILFKGEIAANIPATALADNTPIYQRELLTESPKYAKEAAQWTEGSLPTDPLDWNDILLKLLDTPTIASKRWIYRQYDHQVQNNTVILPGGADAAVIRVRPIDADPSTSTIGVAATTDCNGRYVYLNPYEGAKAAVAEAARNLSCVGAEPLAVTDNLNFGSPENPVGYWQLASACRGIADACREMGTPVTGGNVSLYNETLDSQGNPQPIYPTPVIGMVGLIPDITKVCGQAWQKDGDSIYLLGSSVVSTLGGSEYLNTIHGIVAGSPPVVDFELERLVQKACREGIRQGWVRSAHDCAEGGIAVTLAECCISSHLGASVELSPASRIDILLFSESASRIVVSIDPEFQSVWEAYLTETLGQAWQKIGRVKSDPTLKIAVSKGTLIDLSVAQIQESWENAIDRRLGH
jgi:phosphoribosylformylglycinamidine synthase